MAVRKSSEETLTVTGNVDEWIQKSIQALTVGGFSNIIPNSQLRQITADYKKLTVWGEIIVTLHPVNASLNVQINSGISNSNVSDSVIMGDTHHHHYSQPENKSVRIQIKSSANVDNLWALFSSPNKKIINRFKGHIP